MPALLPPRGNLRRYHTIFKFAGPVLMFPVRPGLTILHPGLTGPR